MTIHSVQANQLTQSTHESSFECSVGTLYELKYHPHRVECFKDLYKKCSGEHFHEEFFSNIEEACLPFFQGLDAQHDDALKFLSANVWEQEVPPIYGFSTPYMLMSDEQFLKINSLYIKYQSPHNRVAERLDYIENTRPDLIHDDTTIETEQVMKGNCDPHFSLKELRQIKNDEVIHKLWKDHELNLQLFSVEQKKAIINPDTFLDIVRGDSRENLQKYLPALGGKILNEKIQEFPYYLCNNFPVGVIPLLDRSIVSANQLAKIIEVNIKKLDQLEMTDDEMTELLTDIVRLTLPAKVESSGNEATSENNTIFSPLSPDKLEKLPDSVFVKFDFANLSERELLSLFYPYDSTSLNNIGYEVRVGRDRVAIIEYMISGSSALNMPTDNFKERARKHEVYNIHRLGLLTKEQFMAMSDRAHPDIIKLGDKIHM